MCVYINRCVRPHYNVSAKCEYTNTRGLLIMQGIVRAVAGIISATSFTTIQGKTLQSPADRKPRLYAFLMLVHCLQCWPNVEATLGQCFMCAWALMSVWAWQMHNIRHVFIQQTRDIELLLVQCCADVVDGGPTLNKHWFNASCLLGSWAGVVWKLCHVWRPHGC